MKTEIIKNVTEEALSRAAEIINSGGLVAFPTETVYGLGGSALRSDSAKKIYEAKGRPSDNPLIIHLAKAEDAEKYAYTNELYYKVTDAFSPGPITVILPKKDCIPYEVTGGLDTVAIRIPSHPVARAFIEACGVAIAAPSANVSGSPSPTTAEHVAADLSGRIDMIIDGGACSVGVESTIVKITDDGLKLLRPGAVTEEMLSKTAKVSRDDCIIAPPSDSLRPEAPGMKYRHYAPEAKVTLVKGYHEDVAAFMKEKLSKNENTGIVCLEKDKAEISGKNVKYLPDDAEGQARCVFSVLRSFDGSGAEEIFCVTPSRIGVGLAVYNRLIKASGFNTVYAGLSIPVIGLTGQSGSGKSEAAAIFSENGAFVASCDAIYHEMLYKNSPLIQKIAAAFPSAVRNGELDRKALSKEVFSDKEKLEKLNGITHPAILDEVRKRIRSAESNGYKLAVVDAPQLFEAGFDTECTAVAAVIADEDIRIKRIVSRDNVTEEAARARLGSQHNEDFFRVYCDVIIENNGERRELEEQVKAFIKKYSRGEDL